MCLSVLPVCIYVYHVNALYPQKAEGSTGYPGPGITASYELPCRFWELKVHPVWNSRHSQLLQSSLWSHFCLCKENILPKERLQKFQAKEIPVVKKAFHEAGYWGNKGNASLTPCFLFNLFQKAVGRRSENNSWVFPGDESEVHEPLEVVRHLETDLSRCRLTWGRAQTAGFYSTQQKAKTRTLLNSSHTWTSLPFLGAVPKDSIEVEMREAIALRSVPKEPTVGYVWLCQLASLVQRHFW